MTPTANLASTEADADDHATAPAAEAGPYVLNLCSSTTPMALAQTDLPELKRFTFFVSRRFEEGRERFRLHMGFFASQAEAEEWLGVVRDIYPGAWAGEAPGKKLRARAAEAAAAQARHAAGPQKSAASPAAPAPAAAAVAPVRAQSMQPPPPAKIPTLVPTLHPPASAPAGKAAPAGLGTPGVVVHSGKAAPHTTLKRAQSAPAAKPLPPVPRAGGAAAGGARPQATFRPGPQQPGTPAGAASAKAASTMAPTRAPQARAAPPVGGQRPSVRAGASGSGAPAAVSVTAQPKSAAAAPGAAKPPAQAGSRTAQPAVKRPIFADSNVKEVLAALDSPEDGTGETRLMPAIVGHAAAPEDSSLTDTQVLRFLETRREEPGTPRTASPLQSDVAAESGISLLKPDDTGTRRALKEAVSHNEPVSFAVQLQWSVQPVQLDKVPPLAIFSAYTLYSVEGSREGRRWYGLRLGFFNDAISAKQVAYYVRSEFNSVAVVPVSPQERERATDDNQRFSGAGVQRKRRESADNEFKLIDSDADPAPSAAPGGRGPDQHGVSERSLARGSSPPAAAVPVSQQPAAAARSARKSGGTSRVQPGLVGARERRTPQTLEETLEILGANELAIDNGSGESLNDTGVRHLRVEIQKNTPFSRLLERLSERVRKT